MFKPEFLIALLIFLTGKNCFASKIYGKIGATVLEPGTMIIGGVVRNISDIENGELPQGLFFLSKPSTETSQELFGSFFGAANIDLVGLDGQKPEFKDGKIYLPLKMSSSDGSLLRANLVFESDNLVFGKDSQAQLQAKIKISDWIKPNKNKGVFRGGYYIQIQN